MIVSAFVLVLLAKVSSSVYQQYRRPDPISKVEGCPGEPSTNNPIGYSGGSRPEEEGFQPINDPHYDVVKNQRGDGYEAISVSSPNEHLAGFCQAIDPQQAKLAMTNGWTLVVEFEALKGITFANIDLGTRFDANETIPDGQHVFTLATAIIPKLDGPQFDVTPGRRKFALDYDANRGTASLAIDDLTKHRGYGGHHQYAVGNVAPHLNWGVQPFLGDTVGQGRCWSVRFEIKRKR